MVKVSTQLLHWAVICALLILASFYVRYFNKYHVQRRSKNAGNTSAAASPPSTVVRSENGQMYRNQSTTDTHKYEKASQAELGDGPPPCSFEFRREQIERQCRTNPPPRGNSLFANQTQKRPGPALTSIVLDHERKIMGCLISKVASTSWMNFLDEHTLIPGAPQRRKRSHKAKDWSDMVVKKSFGVSLEDMKTKYKDYKKYIIVKHSMQRLVSAYYEAVVNRKLFSMSFSTFMEQMASREMVGKNEHWALYSWWCYPCDVTYDYVIKMETFAHDLPLLNEAMGIDKDAKIPDVNRNRFTSGSRKVGTVPHGLGHDNIYRYEKELTEYREKHPDTFAKVMDWYRPDMEMFGYDWNPSDRSTCGYHSDGNTCC